MIEFRAILSAINDEYRLKSRSTINLLYNWMASDFDNGLEAFVDYLNEVSSEEDHPQQKNSSKVLNRLNEVDFTEYLNYIDQIDDAGIEFLPFYSILYPRNLWRVEHPPLCLYVNGGTSGLFGGIAVVGTRDANEERKQFAKSLAGELAAKGYPIVSGLANGIDTMAHQGAIKTGGQTIAVLPGGVQTIRPASNKDLAERIPHNGALVGELSDHATIHRGRFVERNRITSGLSLAVVVVASGESGGTVRQAEIAQEQSKPRFMYDPGADDGQSPDELLELGFDKFSSVDELSTLLNSEWKENRNQEHITNYA